MKNLMDFSDSALSRTEMKSVKGGWCACSHSPTSGTTCGTSAFTYTGGTYFVKSLNLNKDGYSYFLRPGCTQ